MENLIEVKNLKKYFTVPNGFLNAVDDVTFSIREGETLGVVGESGCGKSTLGRVLIGLHSITSGSVMFDGIDLSDLSKNEMIQLRKSMQIIFQDPYSSLNPRFTISQIIGEPLKLHNVYKSKEEIRKRVEELMDMVGLTKRAYNLYPHEFDGGRRQRIVIARALSINPKFVVCDEPVSALDVSVQAQILNLLIELQKMLNLTYLFISHDLSVVKHISDNVLVMYLGQIVEKAPKKDLFKNAIHPYTIALLSAIPSVNVLEKKKKIILTGELSSPINPADGCRFANRCQFALDKCFNINPKYLEIEPKHFVACHRAEEIKDNKIGYFI